MKQPPKLTVAPFKNRNGVVSFRVIGWIDGERIRRNFKTRAEANAEKTQLEIGAEPDAGAVEAAPAIRQAYREAAAAAAHHATQSRG